MLTHIPALAEIARDTSPLIAIQKSAQVGVTEMLVNTALWAADTGYAGRGNALFFMPTQNQMDDFAQSRVDRAIQDSPYLRGRLQPEPPRRKGADSKRLKHLGGGWIFMRGADSKRQIASVDADYVLLDEYDQMVDGTLELAQKRTASSRQPRIVVASTPRHPEAGINALFLQSDQCRYLLPCPSCSYEQFLDWPENVDFERALVVCRVCAAPMDVLTPGRWEAQAPGNSIRGYGLGRLYSPWVNIPAMIEASQASTPLALQEFYNSDLGVPFTLPGGGLSADILDRCRQDYTFADYAGQQCVMGVDVGLKLHVVVRELSDGWKYDRTQPRRLWHADIIDDFEQLHSIAERFNVVAVALDADPETRKVTEFIEAYEGSANAARYNRSEPGFEIVRSDRGRPPMIRLNRTEALDGAFERFRTGVAALPSDARILGGSPQRGHGEFYRELLAPQRTVEADSGGNWVARWLEHGKPDHFAHAEVYCLYAEELVTPPIPDMRAINASLWRQSAFSDEYDRFRRTW